MNTLTCKNSSLRAGLLAALCLTLLAPAVQAQDPVTASFTRSYKLEGKGKYAQALTALERVRQSQQHSYIFQLRVGWLNYLGRKHRLAVQAYQQAARLAPLAVEPLQGMLLPQIAARRWKDALTTADKILGMAPGNDLASTRHAWILYNLGRYDDAEQIYRSVLRSFPANLEMRAGLGWSELAQGRKADARAAFAEVLRFSPQDSSATKGIKALK